MRADLAVGALRELAEEHKAKAIGALGDDVMAGAAAAAGGGGVAELHALLGRVDAMADGKELLADALADSTDAGHSAEASAADEIQGHLAQLKKEGAQGGRRGRGRRRARGGRARRARRRARDDARGRDGARARRGRAQGRGGAKTRRRRRARAQGRGGSGREGVPPPRAHSTPPAAPAASDSLQKAALGGLRKTGRQLTLAPDAAASIRRAVSAGEIAEILEAEDEDDDETEPIGSADREYTLKQLQAIAASNSYGALDPLALETYLSFAEFESAFGRSMSEFAKLPAWRKKRIKKELHLF